VLFLLFTRLASRRTDHNSAGRAEGASCACNQQKAKQQRIFARFPRKVLELLCKLLPQRSRDWPYNMGSVLTAILDHDPALARDPKFVGLRRREAQASIADR
jgi:hypothetical protein